MRTPISRTFRQLGFLRFGLPAAPRTSPEEERVMHLFRNRAELKKSYNQLQGELQQLRDRLKQQEGVTARRRSRCWRWRSAWRNPNPPIRPWCSTSCATCGRWRTACSSSTSANCASSARPWSAARSSANSSVQRELRVATLERACGELDAAAHAAAAPLQALTLQLARQQGWWRYLQRRQSAPAAACRVAAADPGRRRAAGGAQRA